MRHGRTYGVFWLVVLVSLGLCDIGLFYLVLTFVMRVTRGLVARVKKSSLSPFFDPYTFMRATRGLVARVKNRDYPNIRRCDHIHYTPLIFLILLIELKSNSYSSMIFSFEEL